MKKQNIENKTDIQLIRSVKKTGNNECYMEICRRYEKVFYKICHQYTYRLYKIGLSPQDIYNEKNWIILNCIKNFKSNKKTKFSSYLGNYARYLCLNNINSNKFSSKFIVSSDNDELKQVIDSNQIKDNNYNHNSRSRDNYNYILNLLSQLKDKRITNIFKYRYCDDKKMTWSKVAKKMGISVQTCVNIHDKNILLLKNKINSINISDII